MIKSIKFWGKNSNQYLKIWCNIEVEYSTPTADATMHKGFSYCIEASSNM